MEIKNVRLYNRAVEKVLKKEALKIIGGEFPKKTEELKAKEDEYREALKTVAERIKNGELDKEIQKWQSFLR